MKKPIGRALSLLWMLAGGSTAVVCGRDDAGTDTARESDATAGSTGAPTTTGSTADSTTATGATASMSATGGTTPTSSTGDTATDSGDTEPVSCGDSPWLMYGGDARRSFTSDGCVGGPLRMAWKYTPTPPNMGQSIYAIHNAIAATDAIYLRWSTPPQFQGEPPGQGPGVDRVGTDGSHVWTYIDNRDAIEGNWATLALGHVIFADDEFFSLDAATGAYQEPPPEGGYGYWKIDNWGSSATDGNLLYVSNTRKVDLTGPGLYVGAMATPYVLAYQQNVVDADLAAVDRRPAQCQASLAVDAGSLFYSVAYDLLPDGNEALISGLYAFDAATGAAKWQVPLQPQSNVSVGDGRVYLVSDGAFVARSQSTGETLWSASVTGSGQAPVLAGGLAIVAGYDGLHAFDAASGTPAWDRMMSLTAGGSVGTGVAAALGSATLVVTTGSDGIHVLSTATGDDVWHAAIDGVPMSVRDPVIVGKTVYVVDGTGLYALAAE